MEIIGMFEQKNSNAFCLFSKPDWAGADLSFNVGHIQLNYKNPGQFDIFSSLSCRDLVTPIVRHKPLLCTTVLVF